MLRCGGLAAEQKQASRCLESWAQKRPSQVQPTGRVPLFTVSCTRAWPICLESVQPLMQVQAVLPSWACFLAYCFERCAKKFFSVPLGASCLPAGLRIGCLDSILVPVPSCSKLQHELCWSKARTRQMWSYNRCQTFRRPLSVPQAQLLASPRRCRGTMKAACATRAAPPADFDFRGVAKAFTEPFIEQRCPELQPLAAEGEQSPLAVS